MTQYKIPFKDGDQLSWGCYRDIEYVDNFEFDDKLTFETYSKGRSAVTFHFKRENGKEVTMFIRDFLDVVPYMYAGVIKGRFTFVKRGSNFGCKLLEPYENNSTNS